MRGRHQASDGDRQGPTRKKGNKVSETDRAFVRPATAFVMDNRNGFSCSYTVVGCPYLVRLGEGRQVIILGEIYLYCCFCRIL